MVSGNTKRPKHSNIWQQDLPGRQVTYSAGTVLPVFFLLGVIYIPIGVGIIYYNESLQEKIIDYTHCMEYLPDVDTTGNATCYEKLKQGGTCMCRIEFKLDEDIDGRVLFYYGLTNFYQNHRMYTLSQDREQFLGNLGRPSRGCRPLAYIAGNDSQKIPIAPCGLIANTIFNDTFVVNFENSSNSVPVLRTGITWPTEKRVKFRNPPGNLQKAFEGFSKPPAWSKNIYELDLEDPNNNGFQNEDFIVWMKASYYKDFRKFHRILNNNWPGFEKGLEKGNYSISIEYNYPVHSFKGTKSYIITGTGVLGGKNSFLGYSYVAGGSVFVILGVIYFAIHTKFDKVNSEVLLESIYPTPTDNLLVSEYQSDTSSTLTSFKSASTQ